MTYSWSQNTIKSGKISFFMIPTAWERSFDYSTSCSVINATFLSLQLKASFYFCRKERVLNGWIKDSLLQCTVPKSKSQVYYGYKKYFMIAVVRLLTPMRCKGKIDTYNGNGRRDGWQESDRRQYGDRTPTDVISTSSASFYTLVILCKPLNPQNSQVDLLRMRPAEAPRLTHCLHYQAY